MHRLISLWAALLALFTLTAQSAFAGALPVRLKYTSTAVHTNAYTELVNKTVRGISGMTVLNTGANPIELAFGATGHESVQVVVPGKTVPSGMSLLPVFVPVDAGYATRLSVISLDDTNDTGELEINLIYN